MLHEDSWSALRRHAAHQPQDPWLFFPEPPDWRWISLAEGYGRVERLRGSLAQEIATGAEQPAAVGFRYLQEVSRFTADLAVQAAGLVSAPLAGPTLTATSPPGLVARGITLWLDGGSPADGPPAGIEMRRLPLDPGASGPSEAAAGLRLDEPEERALRSGTQVRDRTGAVHLVPAEGLARAAARLHRSLPPPPRWGGGRHVVLHWRPLEDPGERLFLTWAVTSGAAVVLVPESLGVLYALRWCRPTVLQGRAKDLSRLASELGMESSPRRLRRHFRPLTAIVALDRSEEPCSADLWHELGARIVRLPEAVVGGLDEATHLPSEGELPDNMAW